MLGTAEIGLMQETMEMERLREELRDKIIFSPDMDQTEKYVAADILSGMNMSSLSRLNQMIESGVDVNGPFALYCFNEDVRPQMKKNQEEGIDAAAIAGALYGTSTSGVSGYNNLVKTVAARIQAINENFRKPISTSNGIKLLAKEDSFVAKLLKESPKKSLYALARQIPEAKLAAMADTLGIKETAKLIKLGGVNLLLRKAGSLSQHINDQAKLIKLLRGRIVITKLDDAKALVKFLSKAGTVSKGIIAVSAFVCYANLFTADKNTDKARLAIGDTGQLIGSIAVSTATTGAIIGLAEYAAIAVGGVALVSNPLGWIILGICAAAGAYAGIKGGNAFEYEFEQFYDRHIKPHKKAIHNYLIQYGKMMQEEAKYGW